MTQEEFMQRHGKTWGKLESVLDRLDSKKKQRLVSATDVIDLAEFDREYRRICKHLALARQRLYGTELVGYLNDLALRANRRFYQQRRRYIPAVARFLLGGFPELVRAHAVTVWVSVACFILPALGFSVALQINPDLIHSIMGPQQIVELEAMYAPGSNFRPPERAASSDLHMFGFYIWNNVGIGLQTFAGGVMFGIGAIFFVTFNGFFLGAAATHLQGLGYGGNFFPFVAGHSAPELIAIVLSGAAGLNLGWSLLAPGRRGRIDSLKRAATKSMGIVYGCVAMLVFAAFIEAFWSARPGVPDGVKLGVGALVWLSTLSYLCFAGRRRES